MVVDMPMCNIYMKVVNKQQQKTSRLTLFFPRHNQKQVLYFLALKDNTISNILNIYIL